MTPWLDDGDVRLYLGDNLDVLRQLPDRSVHMCATSPPFYGLRDYGTGLWEGGDPDCDHTPNKPEKPLRLNGQGEAYTSNNTNWDGARKSFGQACGKCGAHRVDQQIGLEDTPDQWVERLVQVFREVRRVLRDDGTLWVEIGDSYNANQGSGFDTNQDGDKNGRKAAGATRRIPVGKPKDLLGQPWLLAFALRADGWYLRSEIIWARPNPMPESVTDRPTKSHSTVFLLSKQPRYFYDADAIREALAPGAKIATGEWDGPSGGLHNGRAGVKPDGGVTHANGANARSVWTVPTQPTPFAHFATWPEALVRRMILAGTSERGCCPECGAPWVRDTEKSADGRLEKGTSGLGTQASREAHGANAVNREGFQRGVVYTTVGWSPSCECGDETAGDWKAGQWLTSDTSRPSPAASSPVPCTVLDPFAGSATTMLVARNHGRHSIGIELNADYLQIAARRLQQLSLLA